MGMEHQDELLSAYLDRELSPDERATVDRLLVNAPEARRSLQELEATSRFLRGLPRRPAPDLADDITARLRNEALLRPEPQASRPRARRRIWWVGAPLAAAAAFVLAVRLGSDRSDPPRSTPSAPSIITGSRDAT